MMRADGSSRSLAAAGAVVLVAGSAAAIDVVWVGAGGDNLWSNATNWSPAVAGGPCNAGGNTFDVEIPLGAGLVVYDAATPCEIDSLVLACDTGLSVGVGGELTVLGDCSIDGYVEAAEGSFTALGPVATLPGSCALFDVTSPTASSNASIGIAATSYSSISRTTVGGSVWQLMNVIDPGSHLDLSSLTSIDAGFDDGSFAAFNTQHHILAGDGGSIDLSSVQSIVGPVQPDDLLGFYLWNGGSVDLSSLTTTAPAGTGTIIFGVYTGAELSLPTLTSPTGARFEALTGSSLRMNGPPAVFDSTTQLPIGGGTRVLMNAVDPGSLLELPAITWINAGFNDGSSLAFNTLHDINAGDGAMIDLSGVETITAPQQPDDRVRVFTWNGGSVNLGALDTITSAGSGGAFFGVYDGASLTVGALSSTAATTILMDDPDTALTANGLVELGQTIAIDSPAGFTLTLADGLSFTHTAESSVRLERAEVRCEGGADAARAQLIEVGGFDVGFDLGLLADTNFSVGRLVVGTASEPTVVRLADCVDNANRGGGFEALYLFGAPGQDGLDVLAGSTLILDGINVYVFDGGIDAPSNGVLLNDLFGPGINEVAYEGGTLRLIDTNACPADMDANGTLNLDDIDAFVAAFLSGSVLADVDCNGSLNIDDIDAFVAAFLAGCP